MHMHNEAHAHARARAHAYANAHAHAHAHGEVRTVRILANAPFPGHVDLEPRRGRAQWSVRV
eukprot:3892639-Alexandrium_andersonii.AAC.1